MGLRISRSEQENCLGVGSSCPTGRLSESWEIGILRSSQVSEMSTCCPTESKQIPEVNFSPERGSQQREEPGERMAPAASDPEKPHQDVEQQCRPELPAAMSARFRKPDTESDQSDDPLLFRPLAVAPCVGRSRARL